MDYSLLSLQLLPFLLPLIVGSIVFNVVLYGHLHFKHVRIRKISVISGLLFLPFAVFTIPLIVKMAFDFNIPLIQIHTSFAGLCFLGVLLFCMRVPKMVPSFLQLIGLGLFCVSFYYFLA